MDQFRQAQFDLQSAHYAMHQFLQHTFPNLWMNLQFEHVDSGGYWYTFNLVNDARRQTYCIRHSDIH